MLVVFIMFCLLLAKPLIEESIILRLVSIHLVLVIVEGIGNFVDSISELSIRELFGIVNPYERGGASGMGFNEGELL